MQPRVTWHRLRDGVAVILSAGIVGVLLYTWFVGSSGSESSRLEEAVESKLQELQKQAPAGGAAAARQRMAAVEAELTRLKNAPPAEARAQSRQEMQRWLDQRVAESSRENTGPPASRRTLGLLMVMALALLVLSVSRWLPSRS